MKLKYTGLSHERSFVKADFNRHDIDQGAVRFNADNNWVAEVSDEAAEWLIANEAPDFREATEDDEKEQDLTRVGTEPRAMGGKRSTVSDPDDDAFDAPAGNGPGAAKKAAGSVKKAGG